MDRAGGADSAERKLKGERALLKRALLTEKETVAALKAEVQRRDAESRELLGKVDELNAEKVRLSAIAAQLKRELAGEREAASASLTGGSMFNTLMSSADGSAAEITRLQGQVRVTEEELANQMQNMARMHGEMQELKRLHAAETAKLQTQASEALREAAEMSERMEQAASELGFARKERDELRTQLQAKSALVDELSRRVESKAEALRYVQDLREKDLAEMQARFEAKVPFDDSADADAAARYTVRPRELLCTARRQAVAVHSATALQAAASTALAWMAAIKGAAQPPADLAEALVGFCKALQGLARSARTAANAARLPHAGGRRAAAQRRQTLERDADAALRALAALIAATRSGPGGAALQAIEPHLQALRRAALALPPRPEEAATALSEAASALRNSNGQGKDGAEATGLDAAVAAWAELLGELAARLHQHALELRTLQVDSAARKRARAFISRVADRAAGPGARQQTSARGVEGELVALQQRETTQAARLAELEARYREARAALTAKEKQLEGLLRSAEPRSEEPRSEMSTAPTTSEVSAAAGDGDMYRVVVVDAEGGSALAETLEAAFPRGGGGDQEVFGLDGDLKTKLAALALQVRRSEQRAAQAEQQCADAQTQASKLAADRADLAAERDRLQAKVQDVRGTAAEELALTRSNYDQQLQQLTQHVMRLQDEAQEHERRLKLAEAKAGDGAL